MLEITTKRDKNLKKILLDGYTYTVRQPGAGESLDLAQFGKEVEQLEKQADLTSSDKADFSDKSMHALRVILSFFDCLGNKQAEAHLQSIDPEELMLVVKQVFEEPAVS